MRARHVLLCAVLPGAIFWASPSPAFVEDLCFADAGLPDAALPTNCYPLPSACAPAGSVSTGCKTAAFTEFSATANDPALGVRSLVHTDSVNLMAQAVGFSATDAYWIAAYSGSVDYGRVFVPYDLSGHPVTTWHGMELATVPLTGFERLTASITAPSAFMHFISPYNGGADTPLPGVNGLDPQVSDPGTEPELASFQAWALADFPGGNASAPMCAGGVTVLHNGNYGSGATCFAATGDIPGRVGGTTATAFILPPTDQSFTVFWDAGPAPIELTDGGPPSAYSTTFDQYVGTTYAADARLGIFIHVLGDRVSHFRCEDNGALVGPTAGSDGGFLEDISNLHCDQPLHAVYHLWETGLTFDYDAGVGVTTNGFLGSAYDQLVVFATAKGVLRAGAAAAKPTIVAALDAALQLAATSDRVSAIAKAACAGGFEPFPGAPECPDAGVPMTDAGHDAGVKDAAVTKDSAAPKDGGTKDTGASVADATTHDRDAAASSKAVADTSAGSSSGGCSTSPRNPREGAWLFVAAALVALRPRRRARRPV